MYQSRQEQASKTREKLLTSAKKLFALNGYAKTSVRSINREIGMSDGLLYHYFPGGKKEILEVLVEEKFRMGSRMFGMLNESIDDMSVEEILEHIFTMSESFYEHNADLMRILTHEFDMFKSTYINDFTCILDERIQWLAEVLRTRAERGEIRTMDYEYAAKHVFAVFVINIFASVTGLSRISLGNEEARERNTAYLLSLWGAGGCSE